jgi:hypothetical protein
MEGRKRESNAPSDGQGGLLSEGHAAVGAEDALVPALDDLADADLGLEVAAADGRVES